MTHVCTSLRTRLLTVAVIAVAPAATLATMAVWTLADRLDRLSLDEAIVFARSAELRREYGAPVDPANLGLPEGTRLWLVDSSGAALAGHGPPPIPGPARAAEPSALRIGDEIYAAVPTDEPGSHLVVALPAEHRLRRLRDTLDETSSALAFALAVSMAIAGFGIHHLVLAKVDRLEAAAARIRAGETGVLSGLADDRSEFGRLARTFDAMAAALDQRTKDYQQSLAASESRFERIARIAPTGIYRVDAKYQPTYVNPLCTDLTGRRESEILTEGWLPCIHPEDRPWMAEAILRAQARGSELDVSECRILRPDGSVLWVMVRDAVERDGHGHVTGRTGTIVDVTTQKRITEALRESEERFRKLARIAPVGIFRTDTGGACTYANDALAAMLGRPKHDLNGRTWDQFLHPDQPAGPGAMDCNSGEMRLLRPDGREVWVLVREVIERDWQGRPVGRIGTMSDITGHMLAREALRMSEERFRVALKHSPVMVFAYDRDLVFTWFFNGPAGADALVGRRTDAMVPAAEAERLTAVLHEVVGSRSGRRTEVQCTVLGQPMVLDLWYEPLLGEDGGIAGVVGAAVDVTAERQLHAALVEAREQAEHANETKSRFLAAASHDLRQPFQAMRLFRAALTPFVAAPRAQTIVAKLDEAMTAGEQLLTALLDVSTLEAGIVTVKWGRVERMS